MSEKFRILTSVFEFRYSDCCYRLVYKRARLSVKGCAEVVPQRTLKVSQVAEMFNVNIKAVRRWIASGQLKAFRTPGGSFRIPAEEVERIVNLGLKKDRIFRDAVWGCEILDAAKNRRSSQTRRPESSHPFRGEPGRGTVKPPSKAGRATGKLSASDL